METEEKEDRGSGRSQNVVHTLPRSMASVPQFLTGPLERIDPDAGSTQVLVITPDAETALALAEAVLRLTGPAGIELLPVTSARRAARIITDRPIAAAAGAPRDLRDLVRSSHLKLEGVKTVVLAWAEEILAGDAEDVEALEAVMNELPKDAASVVVTSRSETRVNAFAERYLRRAPREETVEPEDATPPVDVRFLTVSGGSRIKSLRRLLDDMDPPSAAIVVSSDESEKTVKGLLRTLGYHEGSTAVRISRGPIEPATYAAIFYDAPVARAEMAPAVEAGCVVLVALVEPRERETLKRVAGGDVRPFSLSSPGLTARDKEAAVRRELATCSILASRPVRCWRSRHCSSATMGSRLPRRRCGCWKRSDSTRKLRNRHVRHGMHFLPVRRPGCREKARAGSRAGAATTGEDGLTGMRTEAVVSGIRVASPGVPRGGARQIMERDVHPGAIDNEPVVSPDRRLDRGHFRCDVQREERRADPPRSARNHRSKAHPGLQVSPGCQVRRHLQNLQS